MEEAANAECESSIRYDEHSGQAIPEGLRERLTKWAEHIGPYIGTPVRVLRTLEDEFVGCDYRGADNCLYVATGRYRIVIEDGKFTKHVMVFVQRERGGSVDCIITDPIYGRDSVKLYGALAAIGDRVLKPGGNLLAMAGQSHLPDVFAQFKDSALKYQWTLAAHCPGNSCQLIYRQARSNWKPVLWYRKSGGESGGDDQRFCDF